MQICRKLSCNFTASWFQPNKTRYLALDPFLKTVLCFYFYVFCVCVSYLHLPLFVITFVFLYISTDVIIDFNFYPIINNTYIHTFIIAGYNLWRVYNTAEIPAKGTEFHPWQPESCSHQLRRLHREDQYLHKPIIDQCSIYG